MKNPIIPQFIQKPPKEPNAWDVYEREKKKISVLNLTSQQYESEIAKLLKSLGI